jgi:undecaprenyl-diphosphatase
MAEAHEAGEALLEADAKAAEAFEPYQGTRAMEALGRFAELGDQPQMRILCGAVIAAGLWRGDGRMAGAGVRMLAAHTLATWAKDFVKKRVDRTRPRTMLDKEGEDHRPEAGRSEAKEETSFPSGHSAGAAAVAAAFARAYPEHAVPALAAGASLALAQIPRCAHYPTDVGAGLAVGLAAEAGLEGAARFLRRSVEER